MTARGPRAAGSFLAAVKLGGRLLIVFIKPTRVLSAAVSDPHRRAIAERPMKALPVVEC